MKNSTRTLFAFGFLLTAILFTAILMVGGYIAFGLEYEMTDMAVHASLVPFFSPNWSDGSSSHYEGSDVSRTYSSRNCRFELGILLDALDDGRLENIRLDVEGPNLDSFAVEIDRESLEAYDPSMEVRGTLFIYREDSYKYDAGDMRFLIHGNVR